MTLKPIYLWSGISAQFSEDLGTYPPWLRGNLYVKGIIIKLYNHVN